MRIQAVINKKAGGALSGSAEKLAREAEAVFKAGGHETEVYIVEPRDIKAAFNKALAAAPDILVVGGGDGTIKSAATRLIGTSAALGILPLGTVNRLARDLNIPIEPGAALRALANGSFRHIDAADVNGHIFLCNSMLGLPTEISLRRRHLRGRPFWARTTGYFKLLRSILASRRHMELVIDGDEQMSRRVRVLSLAISNNVYKHEPSLTFAREALDHGKLGVYIPKPHSGLGLLWVLVRAALGFWSGDGRLDCLSASRLVIKTRRKRLRLCNDGEVQTLKAPLRYQIHPKALKVFVPAPQSR